MSAAPICKECKWYMPVGPYRMSPSLCTSPNVCGVDLVEGGLLWVACQIARRDTAGCGPNGNFWEPKA